MTDIIDCQWRSYSNGRRFQGGIIKCNCTELGAITIKEAIARSGLQPTDVRKK